MFGGLGSLMGASGLGHLVTIAGGVNALKGSMAGIAEALNAINKLADAAKNVGAEKAPIDKKLGALQGQLPGDLAQAGQLVQNAMAGGEAQSPVVSAISNPGLGMLTGGGIGVG